MYTAENKRIMAGNIQYFMRLKGVTKYQACEALGVKYSTYVEWCAGRSYPRIGSVELMAHYFGCEKKDLIEDWRGKAAKGDGLSDAQRALIQFAQTVPEEKAEMILQVMRTIVKDS